MTADAHVLDEERALPRQAIVAGAAAILLIGAAALQLAGPHTNVDELTLDLITANKRSGLDVAAAIVNGIGSIALAWTLVFLFGISRARNLQLQPFVRIIAIIGGIAAAVAGIAYAAMIAVKASQFATSGAQTYQQANHITNSPGILAFQLIGQAGALLVAIAFVMVSLNAMRVGLLTRFMGYLGMIAGVLVIIPLIQVPVVQAFWLIALAYLMTGRWPSGVPPAWKSGRAEPWPSAQELREQRLKAAGDGRAKPAPKPEPEREKVGASTARSTRSSTHKRKRKRRR